MSEYWKSTPKYWCKHCKTFVVDTKLSRTQHDATGRHQGALARFLRDLHRNNERESNTKEAAKREVERLNALTSGKPLLPSSSSGSGSAKWAMSAVRTLSEAEQKAQLKQLESLGVALPDEFRKEVALPGEWTSVQQDGESQTRGSLSSKGKQAEQESKEAIKEEILRKRKAEEEEKRWDEMDEDEKAMRSFKVETKTYPGDGYTGEDGDLDALLGLGGKGKDKGKAMKKEDGAPVKQEEGPAIEEEVTDDGRVIKREEPDVDTTLFGGDTVVKQEEGIEKKLGDGIAFKKRKVGNLRKK